MCNLLLLLLAFQLSHLHEIFSLLVAYSCSVSFSLVEVLIAK